jgi:TPP-dependent trihydroxycyclohexane-1,2-dione (THcHDO) dehydratase
LKKWICEDVCGFHLVAVYPEDPQKTLCEMVSDGNYGDETATLNSQISIQEDEGIFIILVDNRYEICVKKIKLVIVD